MSPATKIIIAIAAFIIIVIPLLLWPSPVQEYRSDIRLRDERDQYAAVFWECRMPEVSKNAKLYGKPVIYDSDNPRYGPAVLNGKQVGIYDKELGLIGFFLGSGSSLPDVPTR